MLKNINIFIFDVFPTLNLAEKIIHQWLANPKAEENIAAYFDYAGWALLLASVGCWFAGWIAVMAIIFVAGVISLVVGSSV